ncbi:Yos1-like protein [Clathrospora elynae]|uniref:Yos1-like protein n=1 Tax=Clathrospora elynae TaxID=706981 RepID=A0A6A5SPJ6_9PLEO|nr:Yos1-like protein [Clathrospora elynae]
MFFFGLGGLFYVAVLLINAIAILSEDRFLARIGWTASAVDPGFGGPRDDASIKARLINLVSSVRTLMRIPLMGINTAMILYLLVLG